MTRVTTPSKPPYQEILEGQFRVLPHAASRQALLNQLTAHAVECIRTISGPAAAEAVRQDGLRYLHRHLSLDDIPKITERYYTSRSAETDTWRMFRAVATEALGVTEPFYILREVFLRILPPFSTYRDCPGYHQRRRDPDAVKYKFISHAPHRDSWAGDAENLVNLWMAIDDVPAASGMYIIPGMLEANLPHLDEPPYYTTRDANIAKVPTPFALTPGECLVFNCDELHGTRLNTTDVTRVAVTGRLAPTKPVYRPEFAQRNRDQWVLSTEIDTDPPPFLEIHESIATEGRDREQTALARRDVVQVRAASYHNWIEVCALEEIPAAQGLPVRIGDREIAVFRCGTEVVALDNTCPHLYYRLANGPQADGTVSCPGHCLSFDLRTGRCLDEQTFAVTRHATRIEGSKVLVKLT